MDDLTQELWIDVGALDDIPRLGSRVVSSPGGDIAVFRATDDAVFALYDRCPHKGGPLSQGIVHGRSVTCPLHGWVLGLEDGEAKAPDTGCAHRVAIRRVGERLQLTLRIKGTA
jgi:nitrite reductase (NADH) small subunit